MMTFNTHLMTLFAHYDQFSNPTLKHKSGTRNHVKNDLQKLDVLDIF